MATINVPVTLEGVPGGTHMVRVQLYAITQVGPVIEVEKDIEVSVPVVALPPISVTFGAPVVDSNP